MSWYLLPFIMQGACMGIDEIYHAKRGLPAWERVGHPLDTLTVLAVYLFAALSEFNSQNQNIYLGLAIFSCVFITKDEWVHAKLCTGPEQWLHALLFILHPLTFLAVHFLWEGGETATLFVLCALTILFMTYQILRWSLPWKHSNQ